MQRVKSLNDIFIERASHNGESRCPCSVRPGVGIGKGRGLCSAVVHRRIRGACVAGPPRETNVRCDGEIPDTGKNTKLWRGATQRTRAHQIFTTCFLSGEYLLYLYTHTNIKSKFFLAERICRLSLRMIYYIYIYYLLILKKRINLKIHVIIYFFKSNALKF